MQAHMHVFLCKWSGMEFPAKYAAEMAFGEPLPCSMKITGAWVVPKYNRINPHSKTSLIV